MMFKVMEECSRELEPGFIDGGRLFARETRLVHQIGDCVYEEEYHK